MPFGKQKKFALEAHVYEQQIRAIVRSLQTESCAIGAPNPLPTLTHLKKMSAFLACVCVPCAESEY